MIEESDERPFHKTIDADQVIAAAAVFVGQHEECPEQLVEIHTGPWSLVCLCRWCSDLKTYQVVEMERRRAESLSGGDPDEFGSVSDQRR